MPSSKPETRLDEPLAVSVSFARTRFSVHLEDGRVLVVPLEWYPRLARATPRERRSWQVLGGGIGSHWPERDEDVSGEGLLGGRRSMEGQRSFQAWLDRRASTRRHRGRGPRAWD